MKRIAIVAGGDSSEHDVSLRSAQGIWSFLNHDKYETYIITIEGTDWKMVQYDGKEYDMTKSWPVDRNDFSVMKDHFRFRLYHHSWHPWREWNPSGLFRPDPHALQLLWCSGGGSHLQQIYLQQVSFDHGCSCCQEHLAPQGR